MVKEMVGQLKNKFSLPHAHYIFMSCEESWRILYLQSKKEQISHLLLNSEWHSYVLNDADCVMDYSNDNILGSLANLDWAKIIQSKDILCF